MQLDPRILKSYKYQTGNQFHRKLDKIDFNLEQQNAWKSATHMYPSKELLLQTPTKMLKLDT